MSLRVVGFRSQRKDGGTVLFSVSLLTSRMASSYPPPSAQSGNGTNHQYIPTNERGDSSWLRGELTRQAGGSKPSQVPLFAAGQLESRRALGLGLASWATCALVMRLVQRGYEKAIF